MFGSTGFLRFGDLGLQKTLCFVDYSVQLVFRTMFLKIFLQVVSFDSSHYRSLLKALFVLLG